MNHRAEIVEIKQLADTALAFCCRCCHDPSSDSWHTVYLIPKQPDDALEDEMNLHRANVEAKHEAMLRARALLEKLKPKGTGS